MQVPIGSIVVPFLRLPYRILNMNHKKEPLWGPWAGCKAPGDEPWPRCDRGCLWEEHCGLNDFNLGAYRSYPNPPGTYYN